MIATIAVGSLLGALLLEEARGPTVRYGLAPLEHARKVHPWSVRLDAATQRLDEAVESGDIHRVISGLEDVWFWIGRVVCDALAAGEDPRHKPVVSESGAAVLAAYRAVQRSKVFLRRYR